MLPGMNLRGFESHQGHNLQLPFFRGYNYFTTMVISTTSELQQAKERLRELQALLSHTEPGDHLEEEEECEELFDAIDEYYLHGGKDA